MATNSASRIGIKTASQRPRTMKIVIEAHTIFTTTGVPLQEQRTIALIKADNSKKNKQKERERALGFSFAMTAASNVEKE